MWTLHNILLPLCWFDHLQDIGKQFHYRMYADNEQRQDRQGDMDDAPGAEDQARALLPAQRLSQGSVRLKCSARAMEIALLLRLYARYGWRYPRVFQGLQTVLLECLGFARTQSLE